MHLFHFCNDCRASESSGRSRPFPYRQLQSPRTNRIAVVSAALRRARYPTSFRSIAEGGFPPDGLCLLTSRSCAICDQLVEDSKTFLLVHGMAASDPSAPWSARRSTRCQWGRSTSFAMLKVGPPRLRSTVMLTVRMRQKRPGLCFRACRSLPSSGYRGHLFVAHRFP